MLKHHKADIEDIKMDMRYFLKELIKKEIVTPHRTILFVKFYSFRAKVSDLIWLAIWPLELRSILAFSFAAFGRSPELSSRKQPFSWAR